MDLIGKVRPTSKRKNCFVIVVTDYFTKWVEVKAYKDVTESDVIQFIKEMMIHRFGLPQSITLDNGMVFNVSRVLAFAQEYGIKILNSTPYYALANGQAESTNKIIKANLRKVINNNPSNWDELLSKVLWAYQTSKTLSINTTPFSLVYGHD
jgi:IS30 family transposase